VESQGDRGGCEIALTCHLIVADETAKFAQQGQVGLIAGAGGLVRLPRSMPPKLANEMILTGRRFTADEGLQHGLVSRVVPVGTALEGARAVAQEVIASSPTSVRISLQVMEETQGIADTVEAVTHPTEAIDELLHSEDMIEGLTAFAQKRRPQWKNR
jgi:acetyl-CoA C-acetyltransferase